MRVIVAGSGVGGKIISYGLSKEFDNLEIVLIGEENTVKPGLFYFNHKIPGICEKEINVTYSSVGEGSFLDYQKKSRGEVSKEVKTSSFDNIGKTVKGYLLNSEIDLTHVNQISQNIDDIDLFDKKIKVGDQCLSFDYLISTMPLKVFLSLMDSSLCDEMAREFKYMPVYQYCLGTQVRDSDIDEINVKYDLTDSNFYRHSTYLNQGCIQYMVSESITDFDGRTSVSYPGKIIPSSKLTDCVNSIENTFDYVKLCGRYARWDYHYLVDQSYRDAINFINLKLKE